MEKAVVDLLVANELTVTCAESCTGGLLSGRLINVAGVSQVYKSGYVTYSNKAKRKLLGVKKSTLEKHGAVSRQTAEEMARGLSSGSFSPAIPPAGADTPSPCIPDTFRGRPVLSHRHLLYQNA